MSLTCFCCCSLVLSSESFSTLRTCKAWAILVIGFMHYAFTLGCGAGWRTQKLAIQISVANDVVEEVWQPIFVILHFGNVCIPYRDRPNPIPFPPRKPASLVVNVGAGGLWCVRRRDSQRPYLPLSRTSSATTEWVNHATELSEKSQARTVCRSEQRREQSREAREKLNEKVLSEADRDEKS